ncbi:hypothetical protein ACFFGV_20720 [Pontibacillus salicampi]|uniref:Uncharacterized protein n=1 Tax=Pontibacillus salicampi TaxID=1449801 RepID=A0ABV6LUC6_9BACI
MREYSKHDILGQMLHIPRVHMHRHKRKAFYQTILASLSNSIDVTVAVPSFVYVRAHILCEYIEEEYELSFTVNQLIWLLYKEFTSQYYKRKDIWKLYQYISNADSSLIEVYHYGKLVDTHKHYQPHETKTIHLRVNKKEVRNGEALLAEIDAIYPNHIMFEDMIGQLLINFMEMTTTHSSSDQVHTLVKKANKYL